MGEELKGLVFDVQGYSVHDGPGCRTLVFMKGCPLRCEWCSNPEGIRAAPDIMFRNLQCVNRKNACTRCIESCPHHAIVQNREEGEGVQQLIIDRSLCNRCEDRRCLSVCYFEGLKCCGEWRTVEGLMRVFERNRCYWGARGGASFSGGEPLLQHDFMQALFDACHAANIHIAVETTAHVRTDVFLRLMSRVHFAFVDVKHMDAERHLAKTGVANDLILSNIEALVNSKWPGRLVLRFPVIEEFNDSRENIEAVADFMRRLDLCEVNILPFHRLGASKWSQLGQEYSFRTRPTTPGEKLLHIQDAFLNRRIACYVGSDTPF